MSDAGSSGVRLYPLQGGAVAWEAARCRHAAECVRGLPEVFDTSKRPWIQPEHAAPEDVEHVVARCPTRALTFRKDPDA
jgi:uncharacterized Fe-S cluster protein YjdI